MKKHETVIQKKERARRAVEILKRLKALVPKAKMMLTYGNNWELLVAVELSAQCTDKKVNQITPQLFTEYPMLNDYVEAGKTMEGIRRFEMMIYQSGFYKNKTKNILAAARMVQGRFHGNIPKTMKEILDIPGVARKTANVVLGNAHDVVLLSKGNTALDTDETKDTSCALTKVSKGR